MADGPEPPDGRDSRLRSVAIAAGLGYGFDAYAVNIFGLVLPTIAADFNVSLGVLGTVGSIFLVGYTVGTIGFGYAADRWGRRDTLGFSILMYGTTTALGGLTSNLTRRPATGEAFVADVHKPVSRLAATSGRRNRRCGGSGSWV